MTLNNASARLITFGLVLVGACTSEAIPGSAGYVAPPEASPPARDAGADGASTPPPPEVGQDGGAAPADAGGDGGGAVAPLIEPAYYVGPTGSDGSAGTKAAPWKTLQYAVGRLKAGETVYVRGGTYVEKVSISASGTASAPIRVLAYPGEVPVVDGQGRLPTTDWTSLVDVRGSYVEVSGLEIKNSNSKNNRGITLWGQHNRASFLNVHHNSDQGIYAAGDYSTVEDCRVWQNALVNSVTHPASGWPTAMSAARDEEGNGVTEHAVLRRNVVYDNWGEGIDVYEASDGLVEDNVVFNNWSVNIYVSNTWNTVVRRNLTFVTPDSPIQGSRRVPSNIALMDEVVTAVNNRAINVISHDNTVVNNVSWGSDVCLMCWSTDETIAAGAGLKNVLFAHNTVVQGELDIGTLAHANTRILNNIFPAGTNLSARAGITLANNLAAVVPFAQTPAFSNTNYSAGWFKLTAAASGAIDKGTPGLVTEDLSGAARPFGGGFDVGAFEYRP